MRVTILEGGGLAGGERTVGVVDTERLSAAAGARVPGLVARLEDAAEIGADLPGYRLEVDDEHGTRRFTVVDTGGDLAVAGPLEELLGLAGAG